MKKEELFDKLRGGITQQFDMPAKPVKGIVYEDIVKYCCPVNLFHI